MTHRIEEAGAEQERAERIARIREHLEWDRDSHRRSDNTAEADEIDELLNDLAALSPSPAPGVETVELVDLRAAAKLYDFVFNDGRPCDESRAILRGDLCLFGQHFAEAFALHRQRAALSALSTEGVKEREAIVAWLRSRTGDLDSWGKYFAEMIERGEHAGGGNG